MIGFKVRKLKDLIADNSSSVKSTDLKDIPFSRFSFAFSNAFSSNKSFLSFVVLAFFPTFSNLLLTISKSAIVYSKFIVSISLIGSIFPST